MTTTMARKKPEAAPRLRSYGPKTIDERRREVLAAAGLALPALTAMQWAQLYGIEQLCKDTGREFHTLRRVLLGEHAREPIEDLYAIAHAPGWQRVPEAPTSLDAWRLLWAAAHGASS